MKRVFYVLLIIISFCAYSCKESRMVTDKNNNVVIDIDDVEKKSVSFSDIYSEIQFIPLENNPECMLTRVEKIEVTKNGFLVLNKGGVPSVLFFDHDGKFLRRIGTVGKAKGEYQNNVLDITINKDADSVIVATFGGLLVYDSEGKFLFSKIIDRGPVMDIKSFPKGFVYSSEYHGDGYALHVLDHKFNHQIDYDETKGVCIGNWGITYNPIKIDDRSIYYYDQYKSMFYCINMNDYDDIKQISLKSEKMISIDSFSDDDPYSDPFDAVYDYSAKDGVLYGNLCMSEQPCVFELNTKTNEIKMYSIDGWMPLYDAMYNGYQYTLITQDEFLSFINDDKKSIFSGMEKCNLYEVKDRVTELSNFVMVKLKRKNI